MNGTTHDTIAVDPILDALRLASDALEPSQGSNEEAERGSQLAAERAAHAAVDQAIAHHLLTIRHAARVRTAMTRNVGDDKLLNTIGELLDRIPAPTR